MKKIIGIVFLSILLMQVTGSYVYFIVRLAGIRYEMREQLKNKPDEELTRLSLTKQDFKKIAGDEDEVEVNGKMYDIARIVVQDDQVLIYALHDEAEDNLLTLLNEMVERSSKDKKPVPAQLLQLLALQFVVTENTLPILSATRVEHTTAYKISIPSFISFIESPPPQG